MSSMDAFKDLIDQDVYNKQNGINVLPANQNNQLPDQSQNKPQDPSQYNNGQPEMADTFLGKLPKKLFKNDVDEKTAINSMIGTAIGAPGMNTILDGGKSSSSPNDAISSLMKDVNSNGNKNLFQLADLKDTSKKDVLSALGFAGMAYAPELALGEMAGLSGIGGSLANIAGRTGIGTASMTALDQGSPGNNDSLTASLAGNAAINLPLSVFPEIKPLYNYLKAGDTSKDFVKNLVGGDLTAKENIDQLGKRLQFAKSSATEQSLIPKREVYSKEGESNLFDPRSPEKSAYLSDPDVEEHYGRTGLKDLHNDFKESPILNNYDDLQSALKKEIRKLQDRAKNKTIDTAGEIKLTNLKNNVSNLNSDKENFMKSLPENLQDLENKFRYIYATGVGKYEDAGKVIRKLAGGKSDEVSSAQVGKTFTQPTDNVKNILKEVGPEASKNILYNALLKVNPSDAEGVAKTLLDLKKTKGYDQFVTPDMEEWANNMLKRTHNIGVLKRAGKGVSSIGLGAALGGPLGGAIGGALAFSPEAAKFISNIMRK